MLKHFFWIVVLLFLYLSAVEGGRTPNSSVVDDEFLRLYSPDDPLVRKPDRSAVYKDLVLFETPSDQFEDDLHEAINDDDHRASGRSDESDEQQPLDLTGGSLEDALEDAAKDDPYVPASSENSLSDDFEHLSLSHDHDYQSAKFFSLSRVLPGYLPPGLIEQNYSQLEKTKLTQLFQSDRTEDTDQLFRFLAQHIHNRYANCIANLGRWLRHPQVDEPVFYRNCIPCTNAVDLNLQSLFDNAIHSAKLTQYFVNTCDMQTKWISYVSDMEYLSSDRKNDGPTTFTNVVRQNLLPNQRFNRMSFSRARSFISGTFRYVFQGIVRSNRGMNQKGFFSCL